MISKSWQLKQEESTPNELTDQSKDNSNIFLFSPIFDIAKKLLIDFSIHNGKEHQVHNVELVF